MKIIFAFLVGTFVYLLIFFYIDNKKLEIEVRTLKSKIEKFELFQKKQIFVCKDFNLYWEIYDLKNRAETLGFCLQCPLYQEKFQEDMQETFQVEQE